MARTTTIATQVYATGVYGPFKVDQLTNQNTNGLLLTLTTPTAWPTANPMLKVRMEWDNGTIWEDTIPGPQPNLTLTWNLGVPKTTNNNKVSISSGSITMTTYVPVNCGGTLQAV
jgi:hypothetical protein